eukprot:CAMPEP_0184306804 /NCGR_PEP_ID=MMETSP1049-20130417/15702_1 /TAXON_ID=77928 /ORGANISM="Proteomonas sulcata, Strain CCMP704" /LENGTH=1034 /DNA_ID=CAMNT_0026619145 /DNA_START=65 /DNA_END=3169 /DNA_ORIENTATION=+
MRNTPPFNVTEHTDTSLIDFQLTEEGRLVETTATLAVKGSQSRLRPWYNRTRHVGMPTWIPPFVWTPDLVLGIDACVPVYDSSGRPKIDKKAGAYDVWNESLEVVTCCDSTLKGLSEILATLDLGHNGVAYIVEASTGLLLAAARQGIELPVAQTVIAGGIINGFETSSVIERISAVEYPEENNYLISTLSTRLLGADRGWDEIMNETFSFDVEHSVNGTINIRMKTAVLDGSIPGWKVDERGMWSHSDYHLLGKRWVLVLAICPEDFISIQAVLDENNAQIRKNYWLRIVIAIAIVGFNLLICISLVRMATTQLKGLQDQMERVRLLQLGKQPFILSNISEVREIQNAYESLRERLYRLQHYVPKSITTRIGQGTDLHDVQEDILSMGFEEGTVMYCQLNNFHQVAETLSRRELLRAMEIYLEKANESVSQCFGNLNDFAGFSFSAYWLEKDAQGVHAQRACEAANNLNDVISKLNSTWSQIDSALPPTGLNLKATIGIQSGTALIGSYGTRDRLKFGVIGEIVENSQKIAVLAKTVGKYALLHDSTRDHIHGCYKSKFVASTEFGLLYELGARSKHFDSLTGEEFEDAKVSQGVVGALKSAAASLVGSMESILRLSSAGSKASNDSSEDNTLGGGLASKESSRRGSSDLFAFAKFRRANSDGALSVSQSTGSSRDLLTSSITERRFKKKRSMTSSQFLQAASVADTISSPSLRPSTWDGSDNDQLKQDLAALDPKRQTRRSLDLNRPHAKDVRSSLMEPRSQLKNQLAESDDDDYDDDANDHSCAVDVDPVRQMRKGLECDRSIGDEDDDYQQCETVLNPVRQKQHSLVTELSEFESNSSKPYASNTSNPLDTVVEPESVGQKGYEADFESNESAVFMFDSNESGTRNVMPESTSRGHSDPRASNVGVKLVPLRKGRRMLESTGSSMVTPRPLNALSSEHTNTQSQESISDEDLLELPRKSLETTEESVSSDDELTIGLMKGDPNAVRKSLQLARTCLRLDRSLDDRREFTPRPQLEELGETANESADIEVI